MTIEYKKVVGVFIVVIFMRNFLNDLIFTLIFRIKLLGINYDYKRKTKFDKNYNVADSEKEN